MAIILNLNVVKTAEIPVEFSLPSIKTPIIFGKKVLTDEKEVVEQRDIWIKLQDPTYLQEIAKKFEAAIKVESTLADAEREALLKEYKTALLQKEEDILQYLKTFVVYIQNAELAGTDSVRNEVYTISVPDTRVAKPYAGLWESPEECLSLLLDTLLTYVPLKDAFVTQFSSSLFSTHDLVKTKIKN